MDMENFPYWNIESFFEARLDRIVGCTPAAKDLFLDSESMCEPLGELDPLAKAITWVSADIEPQYWTTHLDKPRYGRNWTRNVPRVLVDYKKVWIGRLMFDSPPEFVHWARLMDKATTPFMTGQQALTLWHTCVALAAMDKESSNDK